MLALLGSLGYGGNVSFGQASIEPGEGEGESWKCCSRKYEVYCTDMSGDGCHNYKRVNNVSTCSGHEID